MQVYGVVVGVPDRECQGAQLLASAGNGVEKVAAVKMLRHTTKDARDWDA